MAFQPAKPKMREQHVMRPTQQARDVYGEKVARHTYTGVALRDRTHIANGGASSSGARPSRHSSSTEPFFSLTPTHARSQSHAQWAVGTPPHPPLLIAPTAQLPIPISLAARFSPLPPRAGVAGGRRESSLSRARTQPPAPRTPPFPPPCSRWIFSLPFSPPFSPRMHGL